MTDQDKILSFLQAAGPTLPSKVAKNLGTDILLASAHLSDLKSQGKLRISHLKVGGSPLYFLKGQESKLYDFASGNMNPKNLQVLDRLKANNVLRESDLDILAKVALRSLKDFAIPLNVNSNGENHLFWKWHLLSQEDTNKTIGTMLRGVQMSETVEPATPEPKPEVASPNPEKEVPEKMAQPTPTASELVKEKELQKAEVLVTPIHKEPKPKEPEKTESPTQKTLIPDKPKSKKPLMQKLKEKIIKKKAPPDELLTTVRGYLKDLDIKIIERETIRKNREMNMVVEVPSVIGRMTYFCKIKNKNKCDEKDLSTAYMESQIKKLPLLFLYTNETNKKSREMLDSGAFENTIVRKVEIDAK